MVLSLLIGQVYCRRIRRTVVTPQPTTGPSSGLISSTTPDGQRVEVRKSGKRKRRRGPGGLGRGLARILVDGGDHHAGRPTPSGLVELVGGRSAKRLVTVRGEVIDAALRALMAAFDLRALAVAAGPTPGVNGEEVERRLVMPAGWSIDEGHGAQLDRQLSLLVDQPIAAVRHGHRSREIPIDGHRLWLNRTVEDGRVLAATAVRKASLPPSSAESLAGATRALAASMADRGADLGLRQAIAEGTLITLKSEGDDVLAEVNADWPLPQPSRSGRRNRRTGVGRGTEPVQAVARAAAKACRPRCEVLYAGTAPTAEADGEIAVVVVRHQPNGLRVGWAERSRGDLGAVAEAVFTAAL